MTVQNGYVEYIPTTYEKILKRLGFMYHLGEEPTEIDGLKWMRTDIYLNFSLLDRIRLSLTGRLKVALTSYQNEDMSRVKSRIDFQIYAPYEQVRK